MDFISKSALVKAIYACCDVYPTITGHFPHPDASLLAGMLAEMLHNRVEEVPMDKCEIKTRQALARWSGEPKGEDQCATA